MHLYPEEEAIDLDQAHHSAQILAQFDTMEPFGLQVLAQGGHLLDDLSIDLWRAVRGHDAIDDFFCYIENTTRRIAEKHCRQGSITGNQVFLVALAVQAAIIAILMAPYNPPDTTDLLGSAWRRATIL